jgi:hypothetical protein
MQKPIGIQAIFSKATTLVDGGWRLSFDLGEDMAEAAAQLSKMRGDALYLVVMTQAEKDALEARGEPSV